MIALFLLHQLLLELADVNVVGENVLILEDVEGGFNVLRSHEAAPIVKLPFLHWFLPLLTHFCILGVYLDGVGDRHVVKLLQLGDVRLCV